MFPKPLRIEKRLGLDEYFLLEDFTYVKGDLLITAPSGMWTDLCSFPRTQLDFGGVVGAEIGVIHDYLYRIGAIPNVTKDEADSIFYWGLKELGVNLLIVHSMYEAVKIGGHSSWKRRDLNYRGE